MGAGGTDAWSVGFTPSRVVGVWMGTLDEGPANGVTAVGAAGAVWSAVQRYAARQAPPEGWETPPGLSVVEVCDPSGLLPTAYCPNVVREVFIQGSEPTHFDTLYQPFRVNRETGNLATLFTPLELVEERVYLIPPPEAAAWAEAAGIDQPPREYDTITDQAGDPRVAVIDPSPFDVVRGAVVIEGSAFPEGFVSYRLQYGQGLNPTRWVQIGADEDEAVEEGRLGEWDTEGLSGLYTLQLLVVRDEDRVATAAVPLTIDNTPPIVTMLTPEDGAELEVRAGGVMVIELGVADNLGIARVEVFVDRRNIATLTGPPYSIRWSPEQAGEHTLSARAYDLAGNRGESVAVTVVVRR
jgi:membrane carboxypeptidase/penicillin-binding protein PbpC